MIKEQIYISNLLEKADYNKIKLYVNLGFELSLTDLNGDYCKKLSNLSSHVLDSIINNDINEFKSRLPANLKADKKFEYLCWAIILDKNNIVRYLLEQNINTASVTKHNESAFLLAARFNNINALKGLLKTNCIKQYIFKENDRGFNPFIFACCHKNVEMLQILAELATKDVVFKRNIFGANCLHWLTYGTKYSDHQKFLLIEIFADLLKNKFSSNSFSNLLKDKNALGFTPIDWLEKNKNEKTLLFIEKNIA